MSSQEYQVKSCLLIHRIIYRFIQSCTNDLEHDFSRSEITINNAYFIVSARLDKISSVLRFLLDMNF